MPAIRSHSTATTEVTWDGQQARANLRNDGSEAYYRSAFAWADPDGDPQTKTAYRFIHHMVTASGGDVGAANLVACSAGIAILNGGRQGTTIPDSDRQGVWSHLARHLRDGDREPPELKEQWEEAKQLVCEFAFAKELSDAGQFEGHAAVFGNVDLQGDRIKRGAFGETLKDSGGQWPILFGHNTGRVVGFSTGAEEDTKGLRVRGEFTLASDEGRNAYATAKHAAQLGQKFGLSIGYGIRDGGADYDSDTGIRTLKSLNVYEFSLAAIPANPRARIAAVKSAGNWTKREFEEFLRESGFSKDQACAIASRGFVLSGRRDAGDRDDAAARQFMAELAGKALLSELKGL